MFCHEGTWHEVDRIWTIRADGTGLKKMHTRTMNMEIAGHEFFSSDGATIWYDLQTPRGQDFWLAGYQVATGKRTWYHLRAQRMVGALQRVARRHVVRGRRRRQRNGGARARRQVDLSVPSASACPTWRASRPRIRTSLIDTGFFQSERLVNMSKHDYRLEPNVTFSPDMKWIVFRSNMLGPMHVYAVEIAKSATR